MTLLSSFYGTNGATARAAHTRLSPEVRAALQVKYGDLTRIEPLSHQKPVALRVVRRRTPPAPLQLLPAEDQAALEQKYGSLVHQIGRRPAGTTPKATLPHRKTEHPNVMLPPPPPVAAPAPPTAVASAAVPAARPLLDLGPAAEGSAAGPATVAAPPINPAALQLPDAPAGPRKQPTGPVSNLPEASTAAYANNFDVSELDTLYDRSSSWALGQGGMGAVSTITKRATGEIFALKVRLSGCHASPLSAR